MDLYERDWNHFSIVDFSDSRNVHHIIEVGATLYDNADLNANKWSFGSNYLSYNSIAEGCINCFGI